MNKLTIWHQMKRRQAREELWAEALALSIIVPIGIALIVLLGVVLQ